MVASPPRIVVLGAGRMGRNHIAAALRGSHVDPVGFLEPAPERRRSIESEFGIPGYADPVSLLDACDPDAAIIAAPDSLHAPLARTCLAHGIASLVEKPLCPSASEACRLVAAFQDAGILLAVGAIERFNPAWNVFAEACIGSNCVRSIQIVRKGSSQPTDTRSGVAFDLAVHDLDLLCRWLGPQAHPQVVQSAPSEDRLLATLRFGPLLVELQASWNATPPERTWTAHGVEESWRADLSGRTVTRRDADRAPALVPVPALDPLEQLHEAFAGALRGGATPAFPDLQAHLAALALCQILSHVS